MVDRSGRIVARSSALGGRVLPVAARCATASPCSSDDRLGADPIRVYTAPLGELGAGEAAGGAVVVASDLAEIERTEDRARTLIGVCALVAAVLAAALATLLTRRALRPLTRLSAGARAIGRSGDASQRLPEPPVARRGRRAGGDAERDARPRSSGRRRPSTGSSATPRTSCARR